MKKIEKILLATDFSKASQRAIELAQLLAKQSGAQLEIVHVFDHHILESPLPYAPRKEQWLDEYIPLSKKGGKDTLEKLCQDMKIFCNVHFLEGNPAKKIVEFVNGKEFDLLVLGTHGHTGVNRLLMGSVAEYAVRYANCPVLTVRKDAV